MVRLETAAGSPRAAWAVPVVLAVLTLLVSPDLMPAYGEINAFDEAKYIESGRLLLRGELRELTWGPLVALVYAPFHLIFGRSPDWFVIEAGSGRVLMFVAMCLSTYYLALQVKGTVSRYAILGVLFVSAAFLDVLKNPSDALYVTFSALALAKLIAFVDGRRNSDLAWASLLLGLSVLARFEAIILILPMLLVVLLSRTPAPSVVRSLLAATLPAAAMVGAYLIAFRLTSPGVDLGIAGKSYDSFEVNQPLPGPGTRSDRRALARSLFGTAEENHGSVFRAALRNPVAFVARPLANLRQLPDIYLFTFGKRLGPALLLPALWGAFLLVRTGRSKHLGLMGLWATVPMVSLMFLPLHIARQLSALILVLASVGLTSVLRGELAGMARALLLIAMLLLGAYGLLDGKLALLVVGIVMAGALALAWLSGPPQSQESMGGYQWGVLLLAGGLILRGSYPFPDYSPIGVSPQEQVVHYLQRELPRAARVLESLPLPANAAKLQEISWSAAPEEFSNASDLHQWLLAQRIAAVFVDRRDAPRPDIVVLLEAGLGTQFELGYQSENGSLRVFLPRADLGN